jgi:hypothetical protein
MVFTLVSDSQQLTPCFPCLGHRNIQNTTRYTALAPDRFKSFWQG